MAAKTDYESIRIGRTDGCDTGPGYWPVEAPKVVKKAARDAPEKVTRTKPQMVRLEENDPRFVEWRVKLGILLKQETWQYPHEGRPWYVEFPRGYWLYEKSKHLWVSGYPVKSKLFKSPQDFGVHLLWLLSSSNDRRDCCCVHCNVPSASGGTGFVDGASAVKPRASEEPPQNSPTPYAKAVSSLSASNVSVSELNPQAKAQLQSLAGGPLAPPQQALAPAPGPPVPQASTATPPMPGPLPSLLYRTGELVWYTNGSSWRLGLIAQSASGTHQILPLGHSCLQQPPVAKQEMELRPFQAFTVPPVSIVDFSGRAYDDISWEAVLMSLTPDQARTHRDVILLDASKLAALKIDQSYSLFGKHSQKDNESFYRGVFLGAERIEVGDTLRIAPPKSLSADSTVYLGLKAIKLEETPSGRFIFFGGAFYQLHEGGNGQSASIPDDKLPRALREESIWRKSVAPNQPLSWSSPKPDEWLAETDVKGRFYPTHLLAPILEPKKFAVAVANGDRTAVTPALNGRSDGTAAGAKNAGWKLNRMASAGQTIPQDAMFWFEPQVKEEPGR